MNKNTLEIFDTEFFQKIFQMWDIKTIKLIGNVQNSIYEFENENVFFILRITDTKHRDLKLINAELEWINFLKDKNISVPKIVFSKNMNHIETIIHKNKSFILTVFEKAKGKFVDINNNSEWNNELFKNWGQLTGRIHSLSKEFNPINERCNWTELDLNKNFQNYLPITEKFAIDEFIYLKNLISLLPRSEEDFGLIHSDIHFKNFFIDQNQINLFDFDDSCYNWFIFDFITAFHHALLIYNNIEIRQSFANNFFHYFFSGYKKEKMINKMWFTYLPIFLRLRDLQMYILIYKTWDFEYISKSQRHYLDQLRLRIMQKEILIDLKKIDI